jgi:hypothetical protein
MQYHFNFNTGSVTYTIVATRYEQAKLHFKKVFSGAYVVTYKGRYYGEPVRNGKCIQVIRAA